MTTHLLDKQRVPFSDSTNCLTLTSTKHSPTLPLQKILTQTQTKHIQDTPKAVQVNASLLKTMDKLGKISSPPSLLPSSEKQPYKPSHRLRKLKPSHTVSCSLPPPLQGQPAFTTLQQLYQTHVTPTPTLTNHTDSDKKQHKTSQLPSKQRLNMLQRIAQRTTNDSQSEEEYQVEATPGPGQYYLPTNHKAQFRSAKKHVRNIFISNTQRFPPPTTSALPLPAPQVSSPPKTIGFFWSKLPKFHSTVDQSLPAPGQYNTRQSLQYTLIRNILKSTNNAAFISSSPRGQPLPEKQMPGPGAYQLIEDKSTTDEHNNSYMFKSTVPRQASPRHSQEPPEVYTSENKEQNSLIHVKQDPIIQEDYFNQRPPFLSSCERFPSVLSKTALDHLGCPRPAKSKPTAAPFNSSAMRDTSMGSKGGVGVGLYSSFGPSSPAKGSHNIYYN